MSSLFEAFVIEPSQWSFGHKNEINSVIRIPVVLASELVQNYASYELPPSIYTVLKEKGMDFVPVLKPYSALKDAVKSKGKIPIIINHSAWEYTDENTIGYVKDIKADDKERKIKGMAYLIKKKIPADLLARINAGEVIDVSIGGYAYYTFADEGKDYLLVQNKIVIEHLAILPESQGRCPSGICGLNLDSVDPVDKTMAYSDIIAHAQKRPSIVKINADNTDKISTDFPDFRNTGFFKLLLQFFDRGYLMPDEAVLLKQIETLQEQLKSKDLELAKLRDSSIETYEAKLKDKDTEIATLQKALELKEEEMKELQTKLADAEAKIKEFEDMEKSKLIDELVSVRFDTRENLEKVCLHDLRVMHNTLKKVKPFGDKASIIKTYGFVKPKEKRVDDIFGITINWKEDDVKDGA